MEYVDWEAAREKLGTIELFFFPSMSRVRTNTFAFALGACERGLGGQSKYPGRNTKRPLAESGSLGRETNR